MAKKLTIIFFTLLLLSSLTLASYAAQGEQGKLRWVTPPIGTFDGGPHAFDIKCLVNQNETGTTYANAGYVVQLKSDFIKNASKTTNIKYINNGNEYYIVSNGALLNTKPDGECIGIKIRLYFDSVSSDNNYIRVQYTVTNYTEDSLTYSLGTGADIKIGNNDQAEVKTLPSKAGFTMIEGDEEDSLQYVFYGRDTEKFDVTDVDSIWLDKWDSLFYNVNLYSDKFQNLQGVDSAFAYAWNDRMVDPDEIQQYEVVFQIDYAKNVSLPGEVAKPKANPAGLYSAESVKVELNCDTEGAFIYYTLDGSEPTSESLLYADPIVLSHPTTIKAIAVKDGWMDSKIMTEKYRIGGVALSGKVLEENNNPVEDAQLKLVQGTKTIAGPITSEWNGSYHFEKVPQGIYNIVVELGSRTIYKAIQIMDSDLTQNIILPSGNKNTRLVVLSGAPDIVAGNLERLFQDELNFSEEDSSLVTSGGSVDFELEVKPTQPEEDIITQMAAAITGDRRIAQYLDINLDKILRDNAGDVLSRLAVTQVNDAIEITISIPESLRGKGPYSIIRLHDGVAEELPDLDDDEDTITIQTNLFSVYAITTQNHGGSDPAQEDQTEEDEEYQAWEKVKDDIRNSSPDTVLEVTVHEGDEMPASVMNTLKEVKGVKLVLKYKGQEIVITPETALIPELGRYAYPIQMLLDHYINNINLVDNKNPSTGSYLGQSAILLAGFLSAALFLRKKSK